MILYVGLSLILAVATAGLLWLLAQYRRWQREAVRRLLRDEPLAELPVPPGMPRETEDALQKFDEWRAAARRDQAEKKILQQLVVLLGRKPEAVVPELCRTIRQAFRLPGVLFLRYDPETRSFGTDFLEPEEVTLSDLRLSVKTHPFLVQRFYAGREVLPVNAEQEGVSVLFPEGLPRKALLGILRYEGRYHGVLVAYGLEESLQDLFHQYVRFLAFVLDTLAARRSLSAQVRELDTIRRVYLEVTSLREWEAILRSVAEILRDYLGARGVGFLVAVEEERWVAVGEMEKDYRALAEEAIRERKASVARVGGADCWARPLLAGGRVVGGAVYLAPALTAQQAKDVLEAAEAAVAGLLEQEHLRSRHLKHLWELEKRVESYRATVREQERERRRVLRLSRVRDRAIREILSGLEERLSVLAVPENAPSALRERALREAQEILEILRLLEIPMDPVAAEELFDPVPVVREAVDQANRGKAWEEETDTQEATWRVMGNRKLFLEGLRSVLEAGQAGKVELREEEGALHLRVTLRGSLLEPITQARLAVAQWMLERAGVPVRREPGREAEQWECALPARRKEELPPAEEAMPVADEVWFVEKGDSVLREILEKRLQVQRTRRFPAAEAVLEEARVHLPRALFWLGEMEDALFALCGAVREATGEDVLVVVGNPEFARILGASGLPFVAVLDRGALGTLDLGAPERRARSLADFEEWEEKQEIVPLVIVGDFPLAPRVWEFLQKVVQNGALLAFASPRNLAQLKALVGDLWGTR